MAVPRRYQNSRGVLCVFASRVFASRLSTTHQNRGHYMTIQISGPHSIGSGPGTGRRTVLLTGASGVVGRALLPRLRDFDVVCLVHRSPVSGPNVTTVLGDIARPMFGLAEQAYAELAAKVGAVIHCAA